MKNKIKLIAVACAIALTAAGITGCNATAPNGPINASPLGAVGGAVLGPNSGFNPGTLNPALVFEALSQLPQTGTLNIIGPGVNFSAARNLPPGYVAQPIVPLTPDRIALIEGDFFASQVYGLRNDHSSQDITLVPAMGWTITLHLAYPPSTLNTTVVPVVTPPTTNTLTVVTPGTTNNATIQTEAK